MELKENYFLIIILIFSIFIALLATNPYFFTNLFLLLTFVMIWLSIFLLFVIIIGILIWEKDRPI